LIFKLSQETIAFKLPIDAVFFLQLNYFYLALVFKFVSGFDIRISYFPGSLTFSRLYSRLPELELNSRTKHHRLEEHKREGP